ncbi:hypothetical protein NQ314_014787 [Rhamnusium bicolor]|uniref:Uncharacterized protein n=1 Tax=Rhamnusium bicolor TaxID=1586634 RepID=A0AAV8X0S2_9CUCU|nr:hypothetical protein NQ314_014787 [Rhamnusium bicolor]
MVNIDILENITADMSSMNISFWADKKCLDDSEYLLSCIKLHGSGKYVSASREFSSFLTVDDKGKIYIMDIVPPKNN